MEIHSSNRPNECLKVVTSISAEVFASAADRLRLWAILLVKTMRSMKPENEIPALVDIEKLEWNYSAQNPGQVSGLGFQGCVNKVHVIEDLPRRGLPGDS